MIHRIPAGRVVLTTRTNGPQPPPPESAEDLQARINTASQREADLVAQMEACTDPRECLRLLLELPRDRRGHYLSQLAELVARVPSALEGARVIEAIADGLQFSRTLRSAFKKQVDTLRRTWATLPPVTPAEVPVLPEYAIADGHLVRQWYQRDGSLLVRDAAGQPVVEQEPFGVNFWAQTVEEQTHDNGLETTTMFKIEGGVDTGERLPDLLLPAGEFDRLAWITTQWGMRPRIAPALEREQVAHAIKCISADARRRRVYTHTGWRELDGQWVYLTAAGALGHADIEVALPPALARYRLPVTPVDVREAVRTSLHLLSVAPLAITVPLWGAVYRAPLAAFCPCDVTLWVEGQSGSLKSTLAALFLSHYGDFERTTLPESWESTANALEERAFVLKDALLVIDDYAPEGVKARDFHTKATRLIRSAGNASGRGRLKADLTEATTYWPRGLVVSTGEQHPSGESIRARVFLVEVVRDPIDLVRLTAAQRATACLPQALGGYVQWLAAAPAIRAGLRDRFVEIRSLAQTQSPDHLRSPEGFAHLFLGYELGLQFAEVVGACTAAERDRWHREGWATLTSGAARTARDVAEAAPIRRFLTVVCMLLRQRRITLGDRTTDTAPVPGQRPDAHLAMVGWVDGEHLALIPDAAFTAVAHACREEGEPFPTTKNRLMKSLAEAGLTAFHPGRTTAIITFGGEGGKQVRVLKLRRAAAETLIGESFPC